MTSEEIVEALQQNKRARKALVPRMEKREKGSGAAYIGLCRQRQELEDSLLSSCEAIPLFSERV